MFMSEEEKEILEKMIAEEQQKNKEKDIQERMKVLREIAKKKAKPIKEKIKDSLDFLSRIQLNEGGKKC